MGGGGGGGQLVGVGGATGGGGSPPRQQGPLKGVWGSAVSSPIGAYKLPHFSLQTPLKISVFTAQ